LDLSEPLRDAIVASTDIVIRLASYLDGYAVFTRRPVPSLAAYPMIVLSSDIAYGDEDGISDSRPIIVRDISIYGRNDTPAHYRVIDELGYLVRDLFHRQPTSITVPGWHVIQIIANGPSAAASGHQSAMASDEEQIVGRTVSLTISLSEP